MSCSYDLARWDKKVFGHVRHGIRNDVHPIVDNYSVCGAVEYSLFTLGRECCGPYVQK